MRRDGEVSPAKVSVSTARLQRTRTWMWMWMRGELGHGQWLDVRPMIFHWRMSWQR